MPPQQHATTLPRRSIETVGTWAILATLVVAIFIFIPSSPVSFATTKTFLLATGALITLALYILARLSRGNIVLPPLTLVGVLWLPVVAYALSASFSGSLFANAFWGTALEPDTLGFMLIVAILGTMAALVLRRSEHYASFLRTSAFVLGVIAVLQILIVVIGQFKPESISPAFSIVGSFEDLASLLGLGVISILIAFRFLEISPTARRPLIGAGVLSLVLLAVANYSLAWILVALVSLGLFVEAVMQQGSKSTDADLDDVTVVSESSTESSEDGSHSIVVPLVVLVTSLFFLLGGTLGGALANAFHINTLNVRPSWQSTFSVAHSVYATNPVFGTGPGSFGVEWLKYRDASLNTTVFWNIDFSSGIGFIPTSFVTTGLVGAVAWLALLICLIVFGMRMLIMRAPEDSFIRSVAIISFVGTLYLFTIAIFGLPNAVLLALAFVFAGLFASTMRFAKNGQQWGVLFSKSPRIGFVIVFSLTIVLLGSVVAAYSLVERYVAEVEIAHAKASFGAGDLDAADRFAQNSISFTPSTAAYQLQASVARTRIDKIASSSTMPVAAAQKAFQDALSTGINAALTATRIASYDYQNWLMLGNLYAQAVPLGITGAYDSAKTAYEKAQALNPTNPQILYTLAQLDIAHKDIKSAQERLKGAIALKQDYTTAIFLLSQLEVQDGNVKDALTSALAAAYFTPNNPNILFQVGILSAAQNDFNGAAQALSAAVGADPKFANARYLLAAVYAKLGDMKSAIDQMKAIAVMSPENAKAVSGQIAELEAGKSPFPANLLSISPSSVK